MPTQQIRLEVEEYINPITNQQTKEERLCISDTPLHCGDLIEVLLPTGWKQARIEKGSKGWYLCGVGADLKPVGLIARTIDDNEEF